MNSFKALTIGLLLATGAVAQQPLDTFMFKGSHNSYERGLHAPPPAVPYTGNRVPLNELVLRFNSSSIELDLCLKDDDSFVVKHDCTFLTGEFSPYGLMAELTSDPRIFERLTIIDLGLKYDGCCDNEDDDASQRLSRTRRQKGCFLFLPKKSIQGKAQRNTDKKPVSKS